MAAFPVHDSASSAPPPPRAGMIRQNSDPTSEGPAPQPSRPTADQRGPWVKMDSDSPPKVTVARLQLVRRGLLDAGVSDGARAPGIFSKEGGQSSCSQGQVEQTLRSLLDFVLAWPSSLVAEISDSVRLLLQSASGNLTDASLEFFCLPAKCVGSVPLFFMGALGTSGMARRASGDSSEGPPASASEVLFGQRCQGLAWEHPSPSGAVASNPLA